MDAYFFMRIMSNCGGAKKLSELEMSSILNNLLIYVQINWTIYIKTSNLLMTLFIKTNRRMLAISDAYVMA